MMMMRGIAKVQGLLLGQICQIVLLSKGFFSSF